MFWHHTTPIFSGALNNVTHESTELSMLTQQLYTDVGLYIIYRMVLDSIEIIFYYITNIHWYWTYWNESYRNMSNKWSKKAAFSKFLLAPNRRLNITGVTVILVIGRLLKSHDIHKVTWIIKVLVMTMLTKYVKSLHFI